MNDLTGSITPQVALYSRVSTKDKGQDVENQLTQLRRFCATQGWTVIHEYTDHASGAKANREQFRKMLADASQHKFDLVVFWSLDRLSREGVLQTLQYLQMLTSYGVGYRSYTEQYLDSCGIFKDAVLAILAVIAKQERVRISERTQAGVEKARKAGKRFGRPLKVCRRDRVPELRAAGWTFRQIAHELGVSIALVHKISKQAKQ